MIWQMIHTRLQLQRRLLVLKIPPHTEYSTVHDTELQITERLLDLNGVQFNESRVTNICLLRFVNESDCLQDEIKLTLFLDVRRQTTYISSICVA
jgi:hypothetical protein